MNYHVIITEKAAGELRDAILYIRDELKNPTAAAHLLELADAVFSSLSEFPYRHPLEGDESLAASGIRHIAIGNYLAFYIVRETSRTVSVIRVLYGKREWRGEREESS